MYRITPELRTIAFRARFITPVSHHDASVQDKSNVSLFHREKRRVERSTSTDIAPHVLPRLAALLPVPAELRDLFVEMTTPEFLATALLREFIDAYATADGLGLFSGPERYRRLEERARQRAIRASSVFEWWGGLANDLQVGQPLRGDKAVHAALLAMPAPLAQAVLAVLADYSTTALMMAWQWRELDRAGGTTVVLDLAPLGPAGASTALIEVPTLSANSIRHEMVREPGAWHLLNALHLDLNDLPASVASLLYNASDLSESAPPDAFRLTREICAAYPLLELLSGSTDGFILGSSNLEVSAWLLTTENAEAAARYGLVPDVSALDLLDSHDLTRHTGGRIDASPMPFGFEALVAGSEALLEFRLRPYASRLAAGALVAALDTFLAADATLFGQSARGYGLATFEPLAMLAEADEQRAEYEEMLAANAEELRAGLLDGTLTTGKRVLS